MAIKADDYTLYLIALSLQIKEERATERTWIPLLLLALGVFDLQDRIRRRRPYASP